MAVLLVLAVAFSLSFGQNSESTQDWTMGASQPSITSGARGDGSTGDYMYFPVGTSPMWFEVDPEGNEGGIAYWINDPGQCTENTDPGYAGYGPRWGLMNPNYVTLSVGLNRRSFSSWCQGYGPWCSLAPYSMWFLKDGVRAAHSVPWTPGWYKWSTAGTYTDISFSMYDVDYIEVAGSGGPVVHGSFTQIYDAFSFDGAWAAAFGYGWSSFWIRGDDAGLEDISLDVCAGTGMFMDAGRSGCDPQSVSKVYQETSWGNIKQLFR